MKSIKFTIDNQELSVVPGTSILAAALAAGIEIPRLCFHPDLETTTPCDLCLVEVSGQAGFQRACTTKVVAGMVVVSDSPALTEARKNNLNKILANHLLECDDCVWFNDCRLLALTKRFGLLPVKRDKGKDRVFQSGQMVFDQTKCMGCGHCVSVCPNNCLELSKADKVALVPEKNCVNCGQCILHCPVGALEAVGEFEELAGLLFDPEIITVAQFAPALRTSFGEEFGLAPGTPVAGQLVAALKTAGFDYVFDTALGADFTTQEEAGELLERLASGNNLPAMSSCCPAWVKLVETEYPEFIGNLCTSRSPQIMLGGIIKNYWCTQRGIDPSKIRVVSIMPCVAKKFEISRPELKINGLAPVDKVLTARELARFFKNKKIDFKNIAPQMADEPLGAPSGAGVIYGASGGVFESAFRTAYFQLTGQELPAGETQAIRGQKSIKEKEFVIGGRTVKVCVVSGLKQAKEILAALRRDPHLYDAVEVMACPGGCVGGGGQPLPSDKKIIKCRAEALYRLDQESVCRGAHHNSQVQEVYNNFFAGPEKRQEILHTHFAPRRLSKTRELIDSRHPASAEDMAEEMKLS